MTKHPQERQRDPQGLVSNPERFLLPFSWWDAWAAAVARHRSGSSPAVVPPIATFREFGFPLDS